MGYLWMYVSNISTDLKKNKLQLIIKNKLINTDRNSVPIFQFSISL